MDQGLTKFDMLTDSVKTSMVLLNNTLQEVSVLACRHCMVDLRDTLLSCRCLVSRMNS